jgi:hypothetical protein
MMLMMLLKLKQTSMIRLPKVILIILQQKQQGLRGESFIFNFHAISIATFQKQALW